VGRAIEVSVGIGAGGRGLMRGAAITGLGVALPAREVVNAELEIGVDDAWIRRRTGIAARRMLESASTLASLAADAAAAALDDAGLQPSDVDVVLAATMSADQTLPNLSAQLCAELGASNAGAIDIGAACTGWLAALGLAAALIESRRADHVLVVGAERMTRLRHSDPRRTGAIFGDGAGAVVVGDGGARSRIGPVVLRADGAGGGLITTHREDAVEVFKMDGEAVFEHAVRRLSTVVVDAAAAAGLTLDEIDVVVLHQANGRITSAVARRLGLLGDERIVHALERTGNTAAASLPLTLARARDEGRLWTGARVLLAAYGAGLQWAGAVIDWGVSE
jgi:3-oxoacyl-[acyl-carrier-protein] synthase-3